MPLLFETLQLDFRSAMALWNSSIGKMQKEHRGQNIGKYLREEKSWLTLKREKR